MDKTETSRREALKSGSLVAGLALGSLFLTSEAKAKSNKKAPRWGMVIDLRRCSACRACTVACKAQNGVALGRFNTVVKDVESGTYPNAARQGLPRLCNHCEGSEEVNGMKVPPCVLECPEYPSSEPVKYVTPAGKTIMYYWGATYKRPDGMILYDSSLCIGCGTCIEYCPYGARYFDPFTIAGQDSSENAIGKCTFCVQRVEKGVVPACVNTCQGDARIFGDLNDPKSDVSILVNSFKLKNSVLLPEENTHPQVYYIDPEGILSIYKIDKKTKEAEFIDQIA